MSMSDRPLSTRVCPRLEHIEGCMCRHCTGMCFCTPPLITDPDHNCLNFGRHRWVRTYQGATLDAYKCACGASKTTPGTVNGPKKVRS